MLSHLVAVGDIHGQLQMLLDMIRVTEAHMNEAGLVLGKHWNFVFLGDYIDRGPDPGGVVDLLRAMQKRGAICLRGNHEQMAIDNEELRPQESLEEWLDKSEAELDREDRIIWFKSLPLFHETENHFFVHAGVQPDLPLCLQTICGDQNVFLWIRDRFLNHEGRFEKYIVHGHTATRQWDADVRPNRCNLDTGAGYGRTLSAAVFEIGKKFPIHKISVGGPAGTERLASICIN